MPKFKRKSETNFFGKKSAYFFEKISSFKKRFYFLRFLDPFTYVDLFVIPKIRSRFGENSFAEKAVNVFFALLFAFLAYSFLGILFQTQSPLVIVYSASMEKSFFRGDVMFLGKPNSNDFFGPVIIIDENISKKPVNEFVFPEYDSEERLVSFSVNGKKYDYEKSGAVIVYPAYNPLNSYHNKPIIHRSIAVISARDGNFLLTKGDNDEEKYFSNYYNQFVYSNPTFDQDCGAVNTIFESSSKGCITLYAVPVESVQGRAFFRIPFVGCAKLWLVDDLASLLFSGKLPSDFKGFC